MRPAEASWPLNLPHILPKPQTSSVFSENGDFFRAGFAATHLQKQRTAASEPPNNLRFLIKKNGEHAAGNARKI